MKPMTYKGYSARIEYSDEDECFVGRVAGIRDIITFHGESVEEIRRAFKESINFYLETCAKRGETPNKAYSGKMFLRVPSLSRRPVDAFIALRISDQVKFRAIALSAAICSIRFRPVK